jgi:hypothetical protein
VITELPVVIERPDGSTTWGDSAKDHPMRAITRAVAFDPDGWTRERQAEVVALFDSLAPEWTTRDVKGRELPIIDALDRGLDALGPARRSLALELGGGTGLYSGILAEQFPTVVTLDLSWEMVRLVPHGPSLPVQGDGSQLPFASGSLDALVLVNMFLFPAEVDRVLAPDAVLVWVNSRGAETPIHLTADEVDRALPGHWDGVASHAGWGSWSVHRRALEG